MIKLSLLLALVTEIISHVVSRRMKRAFSEMETLITSAHAHLFALHCRNLFQLSLNNLVTNLVILIINCKSIWSYSLFGSKAYKDSVTVGVTGQSCSHTPTCQLWIKMQPLSNCMTRVYARVPSWAVRSFVTHHNVLVTLNKLKAWLSRPVSKNFKVRNCIWQE